MSRHTLSKLQPTVVYDTYWRFACERQRIFFSRQTGDSAPWTNDAILSKYKFTNVYRACDRVSQFLIRNVIYTGGDGPNEIFFRTILFKLFNKIETWQALQLAFGTISYAEYSFEKYDAVLSEMLESRQRIYSAAYIMPTGTGKLRTDRKHQAHLKLLEMMMADRVPDQLACQDSLLGVFELLRTYPMIGDFLAYQFAIDLNYGPFLNFDENDFVVPGPGARSGIRKCFCSLGSVKEADVIKLVTERQNKEFERLGLDFQNLWGRPLHLIDCQNLFCEVDKYARIYHPEIQGTTPRTRIKQHFSPQASRIDYWFPPKWNINDRLSCFK